MIIPQDETMEEIIDEQDPFMEQEPLTISLNDEPQSCSSRMMMMMGDDNLFTAQQQRDHYYHHSSSQRNDNGQIMSRSLNDVYRVRRNNNIIDNNSNRYNNNIGGGRNTTRNNDDGMVGTIISRGDSILHEERSGMSRSLSNIRRSISSRRLNNRVTTGNNRERGGMSQSLNGLQQRNRNRGVNRAFSGGTMPEEELLRSLGTGAGTSTDASGYGQGINRTTNSKSKSMQDMRMMMLRSQNDDDVCNNNNNTRGLARSMNRNDDNGMEDMMMMSRSHNNIRNNTNTKGMATLWADRINSNEDIGMQEMSFSRNNSNARRTCTSSGEFGNRVNQYTDHNSMSRSLSSPAIINDMRRMNTNRLGMQRMSPQLMMNNRLIIGKNNDDSPSLSERLDSVDNSFLKAQNEILRLQHQQDELMRSLTTMSRSRNTNSSDAMSRSLNGIYNNNSNINNKTVQNDDNRFEFTQQRRYKQQKQHKDHRRNSRCDRGMMMSLSTNDASRPSLRKMMTLSDDDYDNSRRSNNSNKNTTNKFLETNVAINQGPHDEMRITSPGKSNIDGIISNTPKFSFEDDTKQKLLAMNESKSLNHSKAIKESMNSLVESMKRSAETRSIIKQFPSPFDKSTIRSLKSLKKGSPPLANEDLVKNTRLSSSSSSSFNKSPVVKAKRHSVQVRRSSKHHRNRFKPQEFETRNKQYDRIRSSLPLLNFDDEGNNNNDVATNAIGTDTTSAFATNLQRRVDSLSPLPLLDSTAMASVADVFHSDHDEQQEQEEQYQQYRDQELTPANFTDNQYCRYDGNGHDDSGDDDDDYMEPETFSISRGHGIDHSIPSAQQLYNIGTNENHNNRRFVSIGDDDVSVAPSFVSELTNTTFLQSPMATNNNNNSSSYSNYYNATVHENMITNNGNSVINSNDVDADDAGSEASNTTSISWLWKIDNPQSR